MEHSTARKLIKVTTLSLLVLATTSGIAGLTVMAASPALSQAESPGGGSTPGAGSDQPDPTSTPLPTPTPVPLPVP